MLAPSARATKNGSPPTLRNARTGELTPPGMRCCARANSSEEWKLKKANVERPTPNVQRRIKFHYLRAESLNRYCRLAQTAGEPSGKAAVCKTAIRRFYSRPRLY